MTPNRFGRYELRTTDVAGAISFYDDVIGPGFWTSPICAERLPEQAAARGAPPHWLGHVGVDGVEQTVATIVARGGQRLGPPPAAAGEPSHAVLRDPFGAVIGVRQRATDPSGAGVAWHLYLTEDLERAFSWYSALFNWTATRSIDLGPERGVHRMFAWNENGPVVGSMANTARLRDVHPQWLFCFEVPDIHARLDRVRAGRGTVVGVIQTSEGDLVAPCEDPERAAFGLYQIGSGTT